MLADNISGIDVSTALLDYLPEEDLVKAANDTVLFYLKQLGMESGWKPLTQTELRSYKAGLQKNTTLASFLVGLLGLSIALQAGPHLFGEEANAG